MTIATRIYKTYPWNAGGDEKFRGLTRYFGDIGSFLLPQMTLGTGTHYYLSTTGSDSNDGLSSGSGAFRTFNYAQAQLSPGDILNIDEGTYQESSTEGYISPSGGQNGGVINRAAWAITVSGTEGQPITIRANPANTGPVICDAQHVYQGNVSEQGGLYVGYEKYVNISGIHVTNCKGRGIYNWDHPGEVVQEAYVASDIWIEKCEISQVSGTDNDCGFAVWSGRRITLINSVIHDVIGWPPIGRGGWGLLSYGLQESLIRNNRIYNGSASMGGIFLKDHYVLDDVTREPSVECEIAYNLVTVNGTPMQVGPQGANTVEAGFNNIHHNIFHTTTSRTGINIYMAAVPEPTTATQTIRHNLVIGANVTDSTGIYFEATEDVVMEGNLVFGFNRMIESAYVNTTDNPFGITSSDRSVFDSSASLALLARYSSVVSQESYATLAAWQAVTAVSSAMVNQDNPDANSVTSTLAATITDAANGDYTLAVGSPAIGLMADGSDAGPYQFDDEIIGVAA